MNLEIDVSPDAKHKRQDAEHKQSLADMLRQAEVKEQAPLSIDLSPVDPTEGYSWGLLSEFMECFDKGNTDPNALRWSFLSIVSTMKGRDCWVNFGGRPLFPNMYTALVGSPGCGKTTAIMEARNLLDELGYPSRAPEIIDPRKLTYYFQNEYKQARAQAMPVGENSTPMVQSVRQNFLNSFNTQGGDPHLSLEIGARHQGQQLETNRRLQLSEHDELAIISSEFMGSIPPQAKWYVDKILNDLYDAHEHPTYEPDDGVVLHQPVMNILGGITQAGLAQTFKVHDFKTGLLTRIMLVHCKDVDKGNPFCQTHDYKASTHLMTQLSKIYDFKGEMTISKEAMELFLRIDMTKHNKSYDIRLEFYYNRRMLFLTKLCMILALLHGRDVISLSDMVTANTLLLYTEFDMPKCLSDFGNTASIRVRNAIIDYLEKQLNRSKPVTSKHIIENVSSMLGISRDGVIIQQLQSLVQSHLVTALEIDAVHQYHLAKPKNTDIIEAIKIQAADPAAIPEWNISQYAMDNNEETDWGDMEL